MSTPPVSRVGKATLTDILERIAGELHDINMNLKLLALLYERVEELQKQQKQFFEHVVEKGVKTRAV